MLIVQKFGGSSVADAPRVRHVAGIIADAYAEGHDIVVVLSAQGDTTDDLIEKARELNPRPLYVYLLYCSPPANSRAWR